MPKDKSEGTAQNIRAALTEMGHRCGEVYPNAGGRNYTGGNEYEKSAGGSYFSIASTGGFTSPFTLVTVESSEGFAANEEGES